MKAEVIIQDVRSHIASPEDRLPSIEDFQRWVDNALQDTGIRYQLTLRIVDEQEICQLNCDYRGKNEPTNVLSFSYGKDPCVPPDYLGDIVLCAHIIAHEATVNARQPEDHWAHLTTHGILHLLGYDHVTQREAQEMEAREVDLLAGINISNPYELAD